MSKRYIKNVLCSLSNKGNINMILDIFRKQQSVIYATTSTYNTLKNHSYKDIKSIKDITETDEMCDGRVKTLHPYIFSSLLSHTRENFKELYELNIPFFDVLMVNLYPYENYWGDFNYMDIGGHSMIRAAIKNNENIYTLVSPTQYESFYNHIEYLDNVPDGQVEIEQNDYRKKLACEAMDYIHTYDSNILFSIGYNDETKKLRQGLNPQDNISAIITDKIRCLNGNPSMINYLDAIYGYNLVMDNYNSLSCKGFASFKHNSPAGVSIEKLSYKLVQYQNDEMNNLNSPIMNTYLRCRYADPKSSFGDFLATNYIITEDVAELIEKEVCDGVIANGYTPKALEILKKKKKGKFIILRANKEYNLWNNDIQLRQEYGCKIFQQRKNPIIREKDLQKNIKYKNIQPSLDTEKMQDILLAYNTTKYTQSNSVVISYDGVACGIGSGQQNRVDCIEIAGKKSKEWLSRQTNNMKYNNYNLFNENYDFIKQPYLIMSSDGFLPFEDNVEMAKKYNVSMIIQPGGSIRDDDVEKKATELDIEIIKTGNRLFTH